MTRYDAGTRLALVLALCTFEAAVGASAQTVAEGFAAPPSDTRPLVRWWWFGPAVEPNELAREISAMHAGGFGGFEIQPVYPMALDDPSSGFHNMQFLSDEFLEAVHFAAVTGRAEGMRVDITLGSGWPYGGPHIPVTEASAQIGIFKSTIAPGVRSATMPAIRVGSRRVAVFLADGMPAAPDAANAKLLAMKPDARRLTFLPSKHTRTLLVFLQGRTGQQVKRPGVGGEGYVLDHLNAAAVRRHLDIVGEKLMSAFGKSPPYSVFSDSLEVFGSDWTDDFLTEFRRRRGYDLTSHLPALFFDIGPSTTAIRRDWGLTLSELVDERYLKVVQSWALSHHTFFRSQNYGFPPVTLSSNRLVSLAEGEGAQWRQFSFARWASSSNHLYGKAVTSAESWTWLHMQPFRATPLDVKVEADRLILEGVNQFVAHGWPYSPPRAGEPGWSFYAAAVFNDHNPWWPVMADVNAYLQRLSYLLRQGEPVNDVAVLIPTDDAFAGFVPGHASVSDQMRSLVSDKLTQQILDSGHDFDYVDGPALDATGFKHKVLVLPHVNRISTALYRKIAAFAKRGGIVLAVGNLPSLGGGFKHASKEAREVKAISSAVFKSNANAGLIDEAALGTTLRAVMLADFTGGPPALGFVHRKLADGDVYFVANTGNQTVRAHLAFRAQASKAQWWEPRTGEAHSWTPGEEVVLAPYESRVFVFGAVADSPPLHDPAHDIPATAKSFDLSADWNVVFKGSNLFRKISIPYSWKDDPATRFYSGEVVFARSVMLPSAPVGGEQIVLNFGVGTPLPPPERPFGTVALLDGPVREASEIYVNGRRAGSVWAPPYMLDIAKFLHAGENMLEVRVTNTAMNELSGRSAPDYRALNARYGERFTINPRMPALSPLPSGLLQPITLSFIP